MQSQQTEANQPLINFPSSKLTMTQPQSSEKGNTLTFNVAIMFLFYVLSVTLCLSSVSTCACAIFNPVGTFRTFALYLFYTLVLSLLLTSISIALIGVYFDNPDSPESQTIVKVGDEVVLEEHHETSAPQEVVDPKPIQYENSEGSATQGLGEVTLTKEASYEDLAPQEVAESTLANEADRKVSAQSAALAHAADCGQLRSAFRSPPIEAQAKALLHLISAGAFVTNPTACDDGASPPTPVAGASQQVVLEGRPKNQIVGTGHPVDKIGGFHGEESAPPDEMSDAAEPKKHAPKVNAISHIGTAGQDKATTGVITARGTRKIETWIEQTSSAKTDDADDEDTEIMVVRRGPLSEIRSISPDSDFQAALRMYMGKGVSYRGKQRTSGNSTPSLGSSDESEFQGLVRKTFMLGKVGGRSKARSV